jgi:hypothetical protein
LKLHSFAVEFIAIKLRKGMGNHKTNPAKVTGSLHYYAGSNGSGTEKAKAGDLIYCIFKEPKLF